MPSYKPVKKNDKKTKVPAKDRVHKTNGLSLEEARQLISKSIKKLNLSIYKIDG